jgi:hypothetical protein
VVSRVSECFAEFNDALGQGVIGDLTSVPNGVEQFLTRDYFTGSPGEALENGHGFWCEMNDLAATFDAVPLRPDSPIAKVKIGSQSLHPYQSVLMQ